MSLGDEQGNLSPDDQRIVDALMASGLDPAAIDRLPADERERGQRLLAMLQLLGDYPVDDGDEALIDVTLARIDRHEEKAAARRTFAEAGPEPASRGRGLRLPDIISVAAVLLIAASVVLPVLSNVRQRSIDTKCANNLRQLGYGFGSYAADYDGSMPMARAGAGFSWDTLANVVNLAPLLEKGYCDHGHMNCPGVHEHEMKDASYSYQWQPPGASWSWGAGPARILVLGDRNPLIDAWHRGEEAAPLSVSSNHGGRGQNVLSNDGATMWLDAPVIGRDNIWLPEDAEGLRPGAQPSKRDVFLVH